MLKTYIGYGQAPDEPGPCEKHNGYGQAPGEPGPCYYLRPTRHREQFQNSIATYCKDKRNGGHALPRQHHTYP